MHTFTGERTIRLDAPASPVYQRIVDFHRWRGWSTFEELFTSMDRMVGSAFEKGLARLKAETGAA